MRRINYPRIRIFTVDQDTGELQWTNRYDCEQEYNNQKTEETRNEMSEEDENLPTRDACLICLAKTLEEDANLCNLTRYIDVGELKRTENMSYERVSMWTSKISALNPQLKYNVSGIIRIVKDINPAFLDLFRISTNDRRLSRTDTLQSIYNIYNRYGNSGNANAMNYRLHHLQDIMINIDCTYKINGSCITALDFIGKSLDATSSENNFYEPLANCTTRLIFVGNKSFLIGIIDDYHNIYISARILEMIYRKDESADKNVYKGIIIKLFNVLQRCSLYLLNQNMLQYFNDMMISPIINNLYLNKNKFSVDEKISINFLDDLNFDEDVDKDSYIKKKIVENISKEIYNVINSKFYISNIDIKELIDHIKQCNNIANDKRVKDAYYTGLTLYKIIDSCGWKVSTEQDPESRKLTRGSIYFDPQHIYIYKDLNMYPHIAYTNSSGSRRYRILNELGRERLKNKIWIKRLYLDITTGILMCDGSHPNVSRNQVCMGDLKGKVTFTNSSEDEIKKLLKSCEELLTVCNFTSAYSSEYESYFRDSDYSMDYYGAEGVSESDILDHKNETKELESFDDADIEEISENDSNESEDLSRAETLEYVDDDDVEEVARDEES